MIPAQGFPIQNRPRWPNTIAFPKELRDAIPTYCSRALVFDSVSGSHYDGTQFAVMMGRAVPDGKMARTQVQMLVHETGKLDGQFTLQVDMDAETTRALGKFLMELADQAEAK